jgi:hypothetical protein
MLSASGAPPSCCAPPARRGTEGLEDSSRPLADLLRELRALREELAKAREREAARGVAFESAETYRSLLETIRAFLVEIDEEGRPHSPTISRSSATAREYVSRSFEIVRGSARALRLPEAAAPGAAG